MFTLLQRTRKFILWIWKQEGSAAQRARGIAVGVFSGCFPFFGLQTLLGLMLASLVKGNHLLAVAGTWISNPFTYIPLYWFNFKIGSFVLGQGTLLNSSVQNLNKQELWEQGLLFSTRLLLGSTLVGSILGLSIGLICYLCIQSYSNQQTFFD
tara:strand:- start:128 stop:586 length:459 start_codon:yes stop_codon:yes gene_type:complete